MKVMTAEEFARDVRNVLDGFEREKDEVVIMRDETLVARLVPGGRLITLGEAIDRLGGVLTDEEGEALLQDMREMEDAEVSILRKNRPDGRPIPELPGMTASEAFDDLYGTLPEGEGDAWLRDAGAINRRGPRRSR